MFLQAGAMHFDKTFWMHRKHVWADYPTCNSLDTKLPFSTLGNLSCIVHIWNECRHTDWLHVGNSFFGGFKFRKLMLGGQVNHTSK